jgi:hypothetical protein
VLCGNKHRIQVISQEGLGDYEESTARRMHPDIGEDAEILKRILISWNVKMVGEFIVSEAR